MYTRMLNIIGQVPDNIHIARAALTWLMHCKRPLTLRELSLAIAIDPNNGVVDENNKLDDDEMILEICGSLIKIHPMTQVVELDHLSVREYLSSPTFPDGNENLYFIDPKDSQPDICRACITYLSSPPFDNGPVHDLRELDTLFDENPYTLSFNGLLISPRLTNSRPAFLTPFTTSSNILR